MEWTLWTLALFLALRNPQPLLFQDWTEGRGTLKPQKYNSTPIKTTHFPVGTSEMLISAVPREPPARECWRDLARSSSGGRGTFEVPQPGPRGRGRTRSMLLQGWTLREEVYTVGKCHPHPVPTARPPVSRALGGRLAASSRATGLLLPPSAWAVSEAGRPPHMLQGPRNNNEAIQGLLRPGPQQPASQISKPTLRR